MTITIRTYNEILGDIIRKIIAETPLNDLNTGSVLLSLAEAVAEQDFENNAAILNILELLNIDVVRNSDLDSRAADYGLTRKIAQQATGLITISDSTISKRSTGLYQVKPAPIAGQTTIYVNDASSWSATGTLFIGRGTNNFEGPINYTSIDNYTSYYAINLSSALEKDHLISDTVIDAQGTTDRLIPANTIVKIPSSSQNPEVKYYTLRDAVIPAGEDSITGVAIVAQDAGSKSNTGLHTIIKFASAPFTGAEVTNTTALTNGADIESDDDLRERIKSYSSTLARGTKKAILAAVLGVSDSDDNKSVASAYLTEPPVIGDPSILYIDDGTGFQPSTDGQNVDVLLRNASGNEEFLQLANYPLPRPSVTNTVDGPFILSDDMTFKVIVDNDEEVITFSSDDFVNIAAASIAEVIVAINSQSENFKARFTDDSNRILLSPTEHDAETIQVIALTSSDDPTLYANSILKFPTNEFSYIRLYKGSTLLTEKISPANLTTTNFADWNITSSGNIIISVDGTPAQNQTFTTTDFGGSSFASLTISDWVTAWNNKFAGITVEATSSDELKIVSNKTGTESSLEILGGTYYDNWFSNQAVSAEGTDSDFELNRQNGNLRILADINAGDTITAGTSDARGNYTSTASSTGLYNASTDGNSRAANIVLVADSSSTRPRSITVTAGDTITLRDMGSGLTRLTSDTDNTFGQAHPGDFIYIVSRGGSGTTGSEWIHPDNCGLHKITAKGDHVNPGTDTYIEYKQLSTTTTGMNAEVGQFTIDEANKNDGDCFIITAFDGTTYGIGLDTIGNNTDVTITATEFTNADYSVVIDASDANGVTSDTVLRTAIKNAFAGLTGFTGKLTLTNGSADGDIICTQTEIGPVTDAVKIYNIDGTLEDADVGSCLTAYVATTVGAYGVHEIEAAEDIQIFKTDEYPQLWKGSFLTTPSASSVQDIASSIAENTVNISSAVYKTNSVKVSSSTEDDGSIALPVSISNATTIFPTGQELQTGNPSHIANQVSSKDVFTFFKRTSPNSSSVWLGRHTYTDIENNINTATAPGVYGVDSFSDHLYSSVFNTGSVNAHDIVFFTEGNNKRQYRSLRELVTSGQVKTQHALPRTLLDHVTSDTVELATPLQLHPNDSIVFIIDEDATAKTIDIPMSRACQINTDYASTTASVFSANDLDGEDGTTFADTQVWGTDTNNTDFKDYAVWMKARNWYQSGGSSNPNSSGDGTFIVRSKDYGSKGENLRFKIEYPSVASRSNSISHQNNGTNSTVTYFFGSGAARAVNVLSGSGVQISYLGDGVFRYKFTSSGVDFNSVLVGDIVSINEEVGFTNEDNTGVFRIQAVNDVDGNRYIDIYNPYAVPTVTGNPEITQIDAAEDGSVKEVVEITAGTFAQTTGGEYFDIYAQSGTSYRVWMDKTGSDTAPTAGGHTLAQCNITGLTTAAEVGDQLASVLNTLADFSCPTTGTGTILCTDVSYGAVTQTNNETFSDSAWIINMDGAGNSIDGADSVIDGGYIMLYDDSGSVCFWIDVSGSTSQPAAGATRYVEITTINEGDNADTVASKITSTIDSDSKFSASVSTNEITVTDASNGVRTIGSVDSALTTAGFTVTLIEAGVDDGSEVIFYPSMFSIYPLESNTVSDIVSKTNEGSLIELSAVGDDSREINLATRDEVISYIGSYSNALSYGHRSDPGMREETSILCVADSSGSLDGTYFTIRSTYGAIAIWFDHDDSGTAEPAHGASISIEITTVADDDDKYVVAQKVAEALNESVYFICPELDGTTEDTVQCFAANIGEPSGTYSAGTSGFTVTPEVFGTDNSNGANEYIQLYDGINYVRTFSNGGAGGTTDPQFILKTPMILQGATNSTTYSIDVNPNDGGDDGELFKLVPTTPDNIYHQFTQKALSQLPIVADVDFANMKRRIQVKSQQLGSNGAIEVVGGNANATSFSIFGESQLVTDENTNLLSMSISAFPNTLSKNDIVKLSNNNDTQRYSRLESSDSIDVTSGTGSNMRYEYNYKDIKATDAVRFTISDVSANSTKEQYIYMYEAAQNVTYIIADSRSNTGDGEYFDIYAQSGTSYRVYMDTTGGNLTVPAAGGHTLVQCDISGVADTGTGTAGALETVMHALIDFTATSVGSDVTVTDVNYGTVEAYAENGNLGNSWAIYVGGYSLSVAGRDHIPNSSYWTYKSSNNDKSFYIWYNVDGGGTDPAPSGYDNEIEVAINSGDSLSAIVTASRVALQSDSEFASVSTASGSTTHVIITDGFSGNSEDARDGSTATNFKFLVTSEGSLYDRTAGTIWRWRHSDTGSYLNITDKNPGAVATRPEATAEDGTSTTNLEVTDVNSGATGIAQNFHLLVNTSPDQADFYYFASQSGDTFAVWISKLGNLIPPTHANYTGATYKFKVVVEQFDTENEIIASILDVLSAETDFTDNFLIEQVVGINFTDANEGDLLKAYETGGYTFNQGSGTSYWNAGNICYDIGDGRISGCPIVYVDVDDRYVDVVNPFGAAMIDQPIGDGNVGVVPTPIIKWNLGHISKTSVQQIDTTAGSPNNIVTTDTPHMLKTGDTFDILNSSIHTNATGLTVLEVASSNAIRYGGSYTSGVYFGGDIIKTTGGASRTRYKIEKLGYNDLCRLSYVDGAAPYFLDIGVAVDDLLIISGSTFSNANRGTFRVLGVGQDHLIFENSTAVEEVDTIDYFNNIDEPVSWTSSSDIVTGIVGAFENLSVGDWVKKHEDEDDFYVQVEGFADAGGSPVAAEDATQLNLVDAYAGSSAEAAGVFFDSVNGVGAGVYLRGLDDIVIYEGDSVQVSDNLFVDSIVSTNWFSSVNTGTREIKAIGTGENNKPYIAVENNTGAVESNIVLGDNSAGFAVVEGRNNRFESMRVVEHAALDESNSNRRTVYLTPDNRSYKFSRTNGTTITPIGKLGYDVEVVSGIDGYKYYTGLLRTVQRIVDGFEPDATTYPGRRAIGGVIETLPPLINSITLSINVTTDEGINLNEISSTIKSAVIDYIDGLGVGEDVILSEIIVKTMEITGVEAATMSIPAPNEERISIADNEKAYIDPANISIA